MEAFPLFALDSQESVRSFDADGRLHVAKTHISKAAINPYYGREISSDASLGLKPDTVYRMFRPPDELEKAASTFQRLPILSKHVPISSDALPKELIVGALGSDAAFNSPYLDSSISIWTDPAIAGIESGQYKELSSAYRYTPIMTPGSWEGKAYDGIMTDIQGNHLALVDRGRAGSDVVVADRAIEQKNQQRDYTMLMTKKGAVMNAALRGISTVLANDAALGAITANAGGKGWNKGTAKKAIFALDAEVDADMLDKILDIAGGDKDDTDSDTPPVAEDEPPPQAEEEKPLGKRERAAALLKGKVPDEVYSEVMKLLEDEDKPTPEKPAMDRFSMDRAIRSAIESHKAEINLANEVAREVRGTLGDVDISMKADETLTMALNHLGVDHAGVIGVPALRAIYKVAISNKDSSSYIPKGNPAELTKRFPGLSHIGRRG